VTPRDELQVINKCDCPWDGREMMGVKWRRRDYILQDKREMSCARSRRSETHSSLVAQLCTDPWNAYVKDAVCGTLPLLIL
jgi:hypothetical protein